MLTDKSAPQEPPLTSKENNIGYSARSIFVPLSTMDFATGFKGRKSQHSTPNTSIWNRFALHHAPHLVGIKKERRLKLWAGGMSWGCLWVQEWLEAAPGRELRDSSTAPARNVSHSMALSPSPKGLYSSFIFRSFLRQQEAPLPWALGSTAPTLERKTLPLLAGVRHERLHIMAQSCCLRPV